MKSKRYNEGGDVDPLEEYNKSEGIAVEPGPKAEPEPEKPKAAKPRPKPAVRSSAPVPGRPRGESGPVSTTRQMADRAASDAMNARAASEARAAKAREAESEMRRESRGKDVERKTPRLSTAGLNPKTLLPEQRYAKGGSVRGGGCEQRGKTKGRFV